MSGLLSLFTGRGSKASDADEAARLRKLNGHHAARPVVQSNVVEEGKLKDVLPMIDNEADRRNVQDVIKSIIEVAPEIKKIMNNQSCKMIPEASHDGYAINLIVRQDPERATFPIDIGNFVQMMHAKHPTLITKIEADVLPAQCTDANMRDKVVPTQGMQCCFRVRIRAAHETARPMASGSKRNGAKRARGNDE